MRRVVFLAVVLTLAASAAVCAQVPASYCFMGDVSYGNCCDFAVNQDTVFFYREGSPQPYGYTFVHEFPPFSGNYYYNWGWVCDEGWYRIVPKFACGDYCPFFYRVYHSGNPTVQDIRYCPYDLGGKGRAHATTFITDYDFAEGMATAFISTE